MWTVLGIIVTWVVVVSFFYKLEVELMSKEERKRHGNLIINGKRIF